jgi:uncharacterized protein YjiS (DUF1127 family)
MWTPPRLAASHDISAVSETSPGPEALDAGMDQTRRNSTMTRIDATMIAEIGTWQDFPPQSSIRRTLARIAGQYGAWVSITRERRALAELDDRLLRDIGITRYDAAHEVAKPFWR